MELFEEYEECPCQIIKHKVYHRTKFMELTRVNVMKWLMDLSSNSDSLLYQLTNCYFWPKSTSAEYDIK